MKKGAEKVPGWVERLLFPRLAGIEAEVRELRTLSSSEFKRLDEKIDLTRSELRAKIESAREELTAKIDGTRGELTAKIESLEKRLDLVQRVAVLEAEIRELREKASS